MKCEMDGCARNARYKVEYKFSWHCKKIKLYLCKTHMEKNVLMFMKEKYDEFKIRVVD